MKKVYIVFAFLINIIPFQKSTAQCTCSGGVIPDSIVYNQYFDSIISTNTIISFPQFDPAVGVLNCLRLSDTVTTVVSYNLENNLAYTQDYNFETYRRSQFTGPNNFLSSVVSPPKDYGPYTLGPYDPLGTADQVDVGPDTVFNKNYNTKYASASAAYYGTGNVAFTYLTTSTFTILTGSDNAIIKLRAYTRLNVQLVYYWCPFSILSTHISGFNTSLQDENVLVEWKVNNLQPTDKYEIEVSTDGKEFTNLGEGISQVSGNDANFKFIYTPDPNYTGKLFFRIKQTDYAGKILYSEIRTINLNKNLTSSYSTYPNPSITGVNIQFVKSTGGEYEVELINSIGQKIFQKKYTLNKSGSINIEWTKKPDPGIYFLQVRDLKYNLAQIARLQIM
jgi:hypothetical protein